MCCEALHVNNFLDLPLTFLIIHRMCACALFLLTQFHFTIPIPFGGYSAYSTVNYMSFFPIYGAPLGWNPTHRDEIMRHIHKKQCTWQDIYLHNTSTRCMSSTGLPALQKCRAFGHMELPGRRSWALVAPNSAHLPAHLRTP